MDLANTVTARIAFTGDNLVDSVPIFGCHVGSISGGSTPGECTRWRFVSFFMSEGHVADDANFGNLQGKSTRSDGRVIGLYSILIHTVTAATKK